MLHLTILGADTRLLSTLCAACPQGPAGCCVAPPEHDWSDVGRVVNHGGRDFVLAEIAAGNLVPAARGLAVRRVRRREARDAPRLRKCVYHGPGGCTIAPERRPATCNYFLCEDAFVEGREPERGEARRAHARLREAFAARDAALGARIAAAFPDGVAWDAAFLDWLGAETARLAAEPAPG